MTAKSYGGNWRTIESTWMLSCPRYAGAYGFGRTRSEQLPGGNGEAHEKEGGARGMVRIYS